MYMVKNLKGLFAKFKDEAKCREFLVQQRWNGSPVCPYCGHTKYYNIENGKRFKCASKTCYKKYSVTVGTVFEASNIPLSTWFPAMYIIAAHKKGISSVQLAKDLGVTQKTAWFMLHRIRESLKEDHPELLSGIIEADETYMSRKYRSDFKGLPESEIDYILEGSSSSRSKGAVVALVDRESKKVRVNAVDSVNSETLSAVVRKNVRLGSVLHTDENTKYNTLNSDYNRETIFHSGKEWVRGNVTTNHVENFWSVMRRGIYGIYHQISYKHLQAYCDEFAYRYNMRKIPDGRKFELTLAGIEGRLTYKRLVYGKGKENSQETIQVKGE
jgi:transposase-like protein